MDADRARSTERVGPDALVPPLGFADELISEIEEGPTLEVAEQVALLAALRRVQAKELDPVGCRRTLVETSVEALHADLGWLSLGDGDGVGFTVVHSVGVRGHIDITKQSVSGFGAEAARRRTTLIVNDFQRSSRTPPSSRRQLIEAGVRSLVCTPLIAGGLIGLLCIARRGSRPFTRRDSVLLGTLAAQGAMTIYNGSIFAEVEEQTQSLRAALSVHANVHESLLAGAGLAGAAKALAFGLGRGVSIHQSIVAEEPCWYTPEGRTLTRSPSDAQIHIDLVAAGEALGSIEVDGAEPLTALQAQAVEVASTSIISELIARRRSEESEWRLHGELLAELVSVPTPLPRPLAIRARRHGVDLTDGATVMILARDRPQHSATWLPPDFRSALRSRLPSSSAVLAFSRGDSVVLALPAEAAGRDVVATIIDAVAASGRVRAGIGRASNHYSALRQADACLALAATPTYPDVVDVLDLGLFGSIVEAHPAQHITETIRRTIGPVHAADQETRVPLLQTLEVFCAAEGRVELAARMSNVHESTLRYRLARLAEVIGLDGGPQRLLELRVAIKAVNVLRAAGRDPFFSGAGQPSMSEDALSKHR